MTSNKHHMITILGPTATGKTGFAVRLATMLGSEVLSADSRQVYKQMDIGTGKDLQEYEVDGIKVPYHLIDIVEPGTEYNVYQYQKDFVKAFEDIVSRDKMPILCGGTGMYLEAILNGYELIPVPENDHLRKQLEVKTNDELVEELAKLRPLHNTTDSIDRDRIIRAIEIEQFNKENPPKQDSFPSIDSTLIGIRFERKTIRERITFRLKERLQNGMIEEVQGLLDSGIHPDKLKFYGLEYKFLTMHLLDELTYDETFQKLNIAIHQFAKRQETWFRRMERNGTSINWIDGNLAEEERIHHAMRIMNVKDMAHQNLN
ncbi:MAG: tRNA (adenosine(37)-N6)-dimethylallyltransferase MiaA [Cytophagales bacterium]|nr:tRNA (adenosine(37)-N6)-dimethylallyltransferase MiaA [Cytophagales bacterium]